MLKSSQIGSDFTTNLPAGWSVIVSGGNTNTVTILNDTLRLRSVLGPGGANVAELRYNTDVVLDTLYVEFLSDIQHSGGPDRMLLGVIDGDGNEYRISVTSVFVNLETKISGTVTSVGSALITRSATPFFRLRFSNGNMIVDKAANNGSGEPGTWIEAIISKPKNAAFDETACRPFLRLEQASGLVSEDVRFDNLNIPLLAPPVDHIVVTPSAVDVELPGTVQLSAEAQDSENNAIDPQPVFEWSSDDENVATVNASTGLVTAVGLGTCTITALDPVSTIAGTAEVTVVDDLNVGPEPPPVNLKLGVKRFKVWRGSRWSRWKRKGRTAYGL